LASVEEPIRTLNAKSSGRIPRHIMNANPALEQVNYAAARAIYLDPDPTVLRGVLACGMFVRFWTYSSTNQSPGRKRRLRHSDIHGRLASRREGGTVSSYIAAETAELRREQQEQARQTTRLRNRFGVGLGDLTEEEAIRYAQMVSEESFLQDEQRRTSASDTNDTGSTADLGDTGSSLGSSAGDTITPEPSVSGASASYLPVLQEETDDDYEAQIQRALRLSLMEGVNDAGQSPRGNASGEYEVEVKTKESKKRNRKSKRSSSSSPATSQVHSPRVQYGESSRGGLGLLATGASSVPSSVGVDHDDELELALQLSLVEEQQRQERIAQEQGHEAVGLAIRDPSSGEEYPWLAPKGKGKGRQA